MWTKVEPHVKIQNPGKILYFRTKIISKNNKWVYVGVTCLRGPNRFSIHNVSFSKCISIVQKNKSIHIKSATYDVGMFNRAEIF